MLPPAPESGDTSRPCAADDRRSREVCAAETRLLYENGATGIAVAIVIASLLAYAQWDAVLRFTVSVWLLYVLLVSAARFVLVRRYWRASPSDIENGRWNAAFVVASCAGSSRLGHRRDRALPGRPAPE